MDSLSPIGYAVGMAGRRPDTERGNNMPTDRNPLAIDHADTRTRDDLIRDGEWYDDDWDPWTDYEGDDDE